MKTERSARNGGGERIFLNGSFKGRRGFFALFLFACAVTVAAFALSYAWADGGRGWEGDGALPPESGGTHEAATDAEGESRWETIGSESDGAREPEETEPQEESTESGGAGTAGTPIRTVALGIGAAADYINNESIHLPDVPALLASDVSAKIPEEPLVLVFHTHTTEGYQPAGSTWIEGDLGEATYTENAKNSVVAVGRALTEALNAHGIGTIHCTTVHDGDGMRGAYERSAESVRFFLSLYPSIRYVIDLHRDAILDAQGAYVRSVSEIGGEEYAQVMAVVGSDGNGTACESWEENLALALQLRTMLNGEEGSVCRPVTLRNASYNQELSARSLLLEIGTGANSVMEAERSARLVGEALARLLRGE